MEKLSNIQTNFADWYQDVIYAAELVDTSPVKGCFVIRPYCYAIWENIQKELDTQIKKTGTRNAYFPLLIPESFIKKEAKHVEGFAPELAVVTHAGGEKLEEPLVIRPTSETIIYHMFARWIKSWRDLPLKVNQWANVMRWEMRTRPFLRTSEFLWHEGHTAHATREEAYEMALQMLEVYKNLLEDYLAIPYISGIKTDNEKFAGAETTYTAEGLMQDGKALQICTSHILAHSFPEAFDVKFQDKDGSMKVPYCTSWGVSMGRLIGSMIMIHGDQNGLVIPPKIAPYKAVIVPIFKTDEEKGSVLAKANEIKNLLVEQGIPVFLDDEEQKSPGAKYYHWDLRGVPVRIEIGPKDLEKNQAVLVNRVEEDKAKRKTFVPLENLSTALVDKLDEIQKQMLAKAREKRDKQMDKSSEKLEQFAANISDNNGLFQVGWCGSSECEAKLKEYKASIRCVTKENSHKNCFACNAQSKNDVLVAKAY